MRKRILRDLKPFRGSKKLLPDLLAIIRDNPAQDESIRQTAQKMHIDIQITVAQNDQVEPTERIAILKQITTYGDTTVLSALASIRDNPTEDALIQRAADDTYMAISQRTISNRSASPDSRCTALENIKTHGNPSILPMLAEIRDDPTEDTDVRKAAGDTYIVIDFHNKYKITGNIENSVNILKGLDNPRDPSIRSGLRVLIESPSTHDSIRTAARDTYNTINISIAGDAEYSEDERREALQVLGQYGEWDIRVVSLLNSIKNDTDESQNIQTEAHNTLEALRARIRNDSAFWQGNRSEAHARN